MIDLQPFCSTAEGRVHLRKPFSRGEFTYACDGHIGVRIQREPGVAENKDAPDVESIINSVPIPKHLVALPQIDSPKRNCYDCYGTGKAHKCPSCLCACERCAGTGKGEDGEKKFSVSFGPLSPAFDAAIIRRIATLPNVQIPTATDAGGPMYFKFDGGVGIVMPLRVEFSAHVEALT